MRNETLDLFAINFIENHFEEIDLKKCDWNIKTKEQAIKEIKMNSLMAGWVITEVMDWGTPNNYIKEYMVENFEEAFMIKVEGKYFVIDYDNPPYLIETHYLLWSEIK